MTRYPVFRHRKARKLASREVAKMNSAEAGPMRKIQLKAAYGALYDEISRLVREADLVGLIAGGAPADEYEPEVGTIIPRLRNAQSAADTERIVRTEFEHWFNEDMSAQGDEFAVLSEAIWVAWQRYQAI